MDITKQQLSAIHEAAHAVGFEHYDWPVGEVTLHRTRDVVAGVPSTITGWAEAKRPPASIENIGLLVAVALCGYAATRRIVPDASMAEECAKDAGLDWQTIERLFQEAKLEPGHRLAAFYEAVGEAEQIITEYTKAIDRIADELIKTSRITGDDVRRIIKEEKPPS
jgi:hypothetical protein